MQVNPSVGGTWYYVYSAASLAALLFAGMSNPQIVSKVCLARSPVFFIPETKGVVCSLYTSHVLLNIADEVVQTLEGMDPVFRDNATDSQREHKERIRRELGLLDRAPPNAL
jgi:hypothetical protein